VNKTQYTQHLLTKMVKCDIVIFVNPFTEHVHMTSTTGATTDKFPGHQPGDWYSLSREQFIVFAGLAPMYNGFLRELQSGVHHGTNCDRPDPERQATWAAIAAAEAMRKFMPSDEQGICESDLHMSVSGVITWDYITWSGTRLKAVEYRQLYRQSDGPLESFDSCFLVQVPADRDLPGRHHYSQLRSGGAYNN
jgi:hypothetical protein